MGSRINTIMQTCFFALSGVLPREEAITSIKKAIEKTYFKKGQTVIQQNFKAVDTALLHLHEVSVSKTAKSKKTFALTVPKEAPAFVQEVSAMMIKGKGDELPVSKLPNDGTYPTGTTKWEKRNVADIIPVWEPDICIQCGNCSFVCPHSVIRAKFYNEKYLEKGTSGISISTN